MSEVKRLPVDTGVTGWNAILPKADAPVTLTGCQTADYLVVGAGFAGLSAARRLSQLKPDARIVVLDAVRIGEGPAGRNSGFMIDLPHVLSSNDYAGSLKRDLKQIKLNRQAINFAADAADEYGLDEEIFSRSGKTNGAASEKGVQHNLDYAQHLNSLDEPCRQLDAKEMKALTGSDWYKHGLYTPGTAMLQPAAYVRGFAKKLSKSASIYENSPVASLSQENGSWIATTPQGSVRAQKVILATNGHVENFGFYKRRLMHVFLYASMTRALNDVEIKLLGGEKHWGITPSDPAATTMRKISGIGGTRIITRNRVTYDPSMQVSPQRIKAMGHSHDTSFLNRFPQLENMEMEYRWAGRLCMSMNDAPAFGECAANLISACCQNGLGLAKGTLSGMAAAELAVEGETDIARALLDEADPRKLPPKPLDWIGANAFMRWSEFRAGKEL